MKKLKSQSKKFEVLGDGNQKKSYLTNEMLIDGILKIVKNTFNNKQNLLLYNIGNNDVIAIRDIAKIFLNETKSNKKIKFLGGKGGWVGDVPKMRLDVKKIAKEGWTPDKNSKDCIIEAVRNNLD